MKKPTKKLASMTAVRIDRLARVNGGETWFTVLKNTMDSKAETQEAPARFR